MSGDVPMLPGLEDFAQRVDRAGADDLSDPKRYTAMTLLRDYPDVYRQAARALFYYRLPCRTVKDLFRLSYETVQAIRDQVMASSTGAAAFFSKLRTNSQRDIVQSQLIDAIQDRLSNPSTLAELDTSTLVTMLATLDKARPASNGVDAPASRTDVTVVSSDDFDQALDGLGCEKNSAQIGCGDSMVDDGEDGDDGRDDGRDACDDGRSDDGSGERPGMSGVVGCVVAALVWCSTWSVSAGCHSLQLSDNTHDFQGLYRLWCNWSCNSWVGWSVGRPWVGRSVDSTDPTSATAPVTRVSIRTTGGGGIPGEAERGGLTKNAFAV